jgi:hypothetical protein
MIHRVLVCLLLAGLAWGQATSKPATAPKTPAKAPAGTAPAGTARPAAAPAGTTSEAKPATSAEIPPDAPVITVPGICENPPADPSKAADCKTVVTRAEFERLLAAVAPNIAPLARRQIATRYATILVMADKAHKMGLDQGPKYEEMMKAIRTQAMAGQYQQAVQEQAGNVSDQDIKDYYDKNVTAYEEADLQRVFVPHNRQVDTSQDKEKPSEAEMKKRQEEGEAAMKTEAEALQKRAAAGEDFVKLQDEAFTFAGLKAKPPQTTMTHIRRTSLAYDQAFVFDLKAGEVSSLITDASGYFMYKMGEKHTLPLADVKDEIHNLLRTQRIQEAMQSIQQSTNPILDDNYFAVPEGGPLAGRAPGAKPQPKPAPDHK